MSEASASRSSPGTHGGASSTCVPSAVCRAAASITSAVTSRIVGPFLFDHSVCDPGTDRLDGHLMPQADDLFGRRCHRLGKLLGVSTVLGDEVAAGDSYP